MTPQTGSPPKHGGDTRPLDFHRWLASRGMNPSRRRPPGRTAALLMDYRAYLERAVGRENAGQWFEKYTRKVATTASEAAKES
jgi:hypothetical protein